MQNLIQRLKEKNRLSILFVFISTTIFSITLVGFRVHYTSTVTFVFLVWNLILALIPYLISTLLVLYHDRIKTTWLLVLPIMAWLCFFPNAPYILTDLFHLHPRVGVPYWYDLALILFFAWNGLMLGYASLSDIHGIVSKRVGSWAGWSVTIIFLVLAGFGIYLGRYLRWNSWDVISSPTDLMNDIVLRIIHPTSYPHTYGVTIVFSAFLILGYILLHQFARAHRVEHLAQEVS